MCGQFAQPPCRSPEEHYCRIAKYAQLPSARRLPNHLQWQGNRQRCFDDLPANVLSAIPVTTPTSPAAHSRTTCPASEMESPPKHSYTTALSPDDLIGTDILLDSLHQLRQLDPIADTLLIRTTR